MLDREGIAIPRSTSINRDRFGASFKLEFDANDILGNMRRRTTASDWDGETIIFNCFNALSILPRESR
jgi:hypothetical protein